MEKEMVAAAAASGGSRPGGKRRRRHKQRRAGGAEATKGARLPGALGERAAVERCLEALVFGGGQDAGEAELVQRLRGPNRQLDGVLSGNLLKGDSSDSEDEAQENFPLSKKPAWVDDEDEIKEKIDMTHRYRKDMMKSDAEKSLTKEKLQRRLQEQFQRAMGGVPSWAERGKKKTKKDDSEDEEDDLLQKTGNFVSISESLPKGILQMKNCLNANNERPSYAKLTTVQFHPSAQVILTAGLDQSVSLFQVDGKINSKIQSIHLESFPVHKARFSADGERVIATSIRNKMFYVYDMMGGNIIPVNQIRANQKEMKATMELIGSMKINGKAVASNFTPDSSKIYTNSDEGEVFIWDVKSRRCINKFTDEGCLHGRCLALSKNGQYVACGSSSGVVNVYTSDTCLQEANPKPVKAIMNLVTAATSLVFNSTTEILAVASNKADDAVKLVHIPSFTVFSNFPVFRRKAIYLTQSMDFSPRSGFFSIGNNKGKALLYRVNHYSDF
ncbi:PREDICTED: U3 small nucleolar RNA-associated protein 18 homolog [Crocodylus porosus]|uniref:U3 small nucleolar RNA-associated protein 18 homolog n=1 Tax=Crocodylus porosus TaxID=8502 RepID=UPI00093C9F18|nr:PREDICTED: U3 small nucleolar RNA-associated protein 18 homolog [Crocodylus porosus]